MRTATTCWHLILQVSTNSKTVLDDDIKEGNLNDVFTIFNVFKKRYNERITYSLAQLDKKFDFNQTETFTYDRDSLPWAANEAEMNAIWTQRVKYDMLNLKLATPDLEKDKVTLKKRYDNLRYTSQINWPVKM